MYSRLDSSDGFEIHDQSGVTFAMTGGASGSDAQNNQGYCALERSHQPGNHKNVNSDREETIGEVAQMTQHHDYFVIGKHQGSPNDEKGASGNCSNGEDRSAEHIRSDRQGYTVLQLGQQGSGIEVDEERAPQRPLSSAKRTNDTGGPIP